MKIVDYTKMTLKELEKEHLKENQKLLDMMISGKYEKKIIEFQKRLVDDIYKMISKKHNKIKKQIG